MTPDPLSYGLFLVGVRGSVATTVLHGLEGLCAGYPPVGMLTETDVFADQPLVSTNSLRVSGWDVAGDLHRSAAELARLNVLPRDLVDLSALLRDRVEREIAPGIPEPEDEKIVDAKSAERAKLPAKEQLEALRGDLREWVESGRLRGGVVMHLASAERGRELAPEWMSRDADPIALLDNAPIDFPPSILYALAAILEGMPYVNFTPSPGASLPAVAGFAARQGVPVLGNDGKTGETLVKTALAPMFRDRALKVLAWEGYNMLGNRDGAALADPQRKVAKIKNKDQVLPAILGKSDTRHTGVSIDFVPSLHDWKTAMDYIHFEGFLGVQMSMQFTWHASDSALAAPLVLDLARLALLAQSRGHAGPLHAAAPFFKNPIEVDEQDFHRQMEVLRKWLGNS